MSRPRKQPAEKRSLRLPAASVTPAEFAEVERQASVVGLSAPEFVRRCVLGRRIAPRRTHSDDAILVELNRIGVNINQMARATNSGRPPLAGDLRAALAALLRTLERLHQSECRPQPEFGKIDAPNELHRSEREAEPACGQIDAAGAGDGRREEPSEGPRDGS